MSPASLSGRVPINKTGAGSNPQLVVALCLNYSAVFPMLKNAYCK